MRGRHRRLKRLLFHAAARVCFVTANALPRRFALSIFAGIGSLVHLVDRPAVARSRRHLEFAKRLRLDERSRDEIVRRMFRDHGKSLADLLRLPRSSPATILSLVEWEGVEHLESAAAAGRGVLAVSAHLGNWELLGAALAARGHRVHVLARRLFDARSDRLLNSWRRRAGLTVHPSEAGLWGVARALRRGHLVGVLLDQDAGSAGLEVEFFGRPARTSAAPFALARRLGVPIVPMTIAREGRTYRARIHPPIPPSAAPSESARLAEELRAWHSILERAIDEHPTQWVWFHPRWKSAGPEPSLAPRNDRGVLASKAACLPASRRIVISR